MIKKTVLLLLSVISLNLIHAQKSSVFLKGGLNLANVSINESGNIDDAKMLLSFHAGIQGELYTQVLDGLSDGDQVVTLGSFFIDAEQKLKATAGSCMSSGVPANTRRRRFMRAFRASCTRRCSTA